MKFNIELTVSPEDTVNENEVEKVVVEWVKVQMDSMLHSLSKDEYIVGGDYSISRMELKRVRIAW